MNKVFLLLLLVVAGIIANAQDFGSSDEINDNWFFNILFNDSIRVSNELLTKAAICHIA